jgi:predicted acetyltransferase
MEDYPIIQNMARFYVYDLSRECGLISEDWSMPDDGLYESFDFKSYFIDKDRKAYIVKVGDELGGFALLNKTGTNPNTDWNMGEFFIIAKFQGKGIGKQVAYKIFDDNPGSWEISVIPENQPALIFWEHIINVYTQGSFRQEIKTVSFDKHQPKRTIFTFNKNVRSAIF